MTGAADQLGLRASRCERRVRCLPQLGVGALERELVGGIERGELARQELGLCGGGTGLPGDPLGVVEQGARALRIARGLGRELEIALSERLAALLQPLDRAAHRPRACRRALLLERERRELSLGPFSARRRLAQQSVRSAVVSPGGPEARVRAVPERARLGELGAEQAQARLRELPGDHLCPLGGRRLQLERSQPCAHLTLDVGGALEVGAHAAELQLCPLAAALELAETGCFLDEPAPLVGSREQHLIDAALGDDAVQLAPQARVCEQIAHVHAADGRAVEQVVAVALARDPAHDRDLGSRARQAAVGVVEHELDLADARGGMALRAGEEDLLAARRAQHPGGLRRHRPRQRIRDVRLARAVRADDHRHPGLEAQLDRVAERLEPADAERCEVHYGVARPASAIRAAACSEAFFEGPLPEPATTSPITASELNRRRWAGPAVSTSR